MAASLVPPIPVGAKVDSDSFMQFFEVLRRQANAPFYYRLSTDPVLTDLPAGTWSVWKNTTSGLLKIWANDNGVLKSVTLT